MFKCCLDGLRASKGKFSKLSFFIPLVTSIKQFLDQPRNSNMLKRTLRHVIVKRLRSAV